MKTIQLFGSGVDSYSKVVTAQRRINCFYDPRPDGEKGTFVVRGTPGSQLWIELPTAPIRGWWVVRDVLYAVAGKVLYGISKLGVATSLGVLPTEHGLVSMSDNGVQVIMVDAVGGYVLTISTNTLGTITDVNFPNGATTVAFIDGRFLVNQAGTRQAWASASYDGLTWTPIIFFTKENYSDLLKAVDVLNGTIILWGTTSTEFWQDVGGVALPYQRIAGSTQPWGLAALQSRAMLNGTVLFLGQAPQGGVQVFMLNGYTPTRVSTSDIENIINGFATVADAVALTYMVDGHPMYQITFPTGGRSFLYDALTSIWSDTQTGTALCARHFGNLGIVFNGKDYIADATTGNIYNLSEVVYTDNGTAIKRQIVSKHIRDGGNRFTIDELFIDMDTGDSTQAGQGATPTAVLEVSKDGGRTYGIPRFISMGAVGQYLSRVVAYRFGMSRDFVFRLTVTDPVPFIIADSGVSVRQGAKVAQK